MNYPIGSSVIYDGKIWEVDSVYFTLRQLLRYDNYEPEFMTVPVWVLDKENLTIYTEYELEQINK